MLIIAGVITIDPSQRAAALEAAEPMMIASNAEAGCHEYVFSADPLDPAKLRLFELWEDQAALDAHFESEHMATFQAAIATFDIRERKLTRYEATEIA